MRCWRHGRGRRADRRPRLVLRPDAATARSVLKTICTRVAFAGLLRAADGVDLRALGRPLADGGQVHPRLRVGGHVDGRRGAPAVVEIHCSSTRSGRRCGPALPSGSATCSATPSTTCWRSSRRWAASDCGSSPALRAVFVTKWWQRELFVWQLRMDRVTVDELHEMMRRQARSHASSTCARRCRRRSPAASRARSRWIPSNLRVDLLVD